MQCPHCGNEPRQIKNGQTRFWQPALFCPLCQRSYTPEGKKQDHSAPVHQQAVRYWLEGLSQHKVARLLDVAPQSVANWLVQAGEKLQESGVQQFYRDSFSPYRELVYRQGERAARHDGSPGKEPTYTVESTNADLRCYGPALDRRGRCFPRHTDKFRSVVRLFITCYNHYCLSRLKYPNRKVNPSDFLPPLF